MNKLSPGTLCITINAQYRQNIGLEVEVLEYLGELELDQVGFSRGFNFRCTMPGETYIVRTINRKAVVQIVNRTTGDKNKAFVSEFIVHRSRLLPIGNKNEDSSIKTENKLNVPETV